MKETAITAKLTKLLREAGCWVYKVHGTAMSRGGVPDLLVCAGGLFYGIEVKADRGVVSPRQRAELGAIRDAGGLGLVCQGADEIAMVLDKIGVES